MVVADGSGRWYKRRSLAGGILKKTLGTGRMFLDLDFQRILPLVEWVRYRKYVRIVLMSAFSAVGPFLVSWVDK